MCQECRQYPCHPRCPNADSPKVFCLCYICGEEIYEGNDVYILDDMHICEECIRHGKREAICEDEDYYD